MIDVSIWVAGKNILLKEMGTQRALGWEKEKAKEDKVIRLTSIRHSRKSLEK